MFGTIIENISGKRLAVIVVTLLLCSLSCFIIGGLIAPTPTNVLNVLGTACKDSFTGKNNTTEWFYSRGKGKCNTSYPEINQDLNETDIVYVFQIPVPRDSRNLVFSRWEQILKGLIQIDKEYQSKQDIISKYYLKIDARLAYRNKGDSEDAWKFQSQSIQKRYLDCSNSVEDPEKNIHPCSALPLFKISSLYHDYYLLNIRLLSTTSDSNDTGSFQDMWLTIVNQNADYTKVWLSLKTVFLPCIITLVVWFWRRINKVHRKPILLEKNLLSLGIGLCFLNMPLEYLTLRFDLPLVLFFADIRQAVFYTKLFAFCLIFVGDHNMLIQDATSQSSLKQYRYQLSAVVMVCLFIFIFDLFERGIPFGSPFYIVWFEDLGINLRFITLGIFTGIYFLFLCYKVWQVFFNISRKNKSLPNPSFVRRLHYEGAITRFKFIMIVTLLFAALAVIYFILGQIVEGQLKWHDNVELTNTSAFFIGVYGFLNFYIFAVLILYAPSRKSWSGTNNTDNKVLSINSQ